MWSNPIVLLFSLASELLSVLQRGQNTLLPHLAALRMMKNLGVKSHASLVERNTCSRVSMNFKQVFSVSSGLSAAVLPWKVQPGAVPRAQVLHRYKKLLLTNLPGTQRGVWARTVLYPKAQPDHRAAIICCLSVQYHPGTPVCVLRLSVYFCCHYWNWQQYSHLHCLDSKKHQLEGKSQMGGWSYVLWHCNQWFRASSKALGKSYLVLCWHLKSN